MSDKKQTQKEKRNAKGGGSVRQRPDGKWEARCTINGKSRSFYADKQADALKLMRDAQKAVDDQTYVEPSKLTVGQWLDIWLEEYSKPKIKLTSYLSRKRNISQHIKPALGNIKLQKLNTTQIQMFYNRLINDNILSPYTLKCHIHATLNTSLELAQKLQYIVKNPAKLCTLLPRRIERENNVLTETEIQTLLTELGTVEYGNLIKFTLFTGLRLGEVLGLPWDAVNFKQNTITIKQQLQGTWASRDNFYLSTPKNGKPRTIYPPQFVMDLLKATKKEQLELRLKLGLAWKNNWNLVFTTKAGEAIAPKAVQNTLKKIVTQMNRSDFRFHDLRHTYTVMAFRAGDDPKTVQEALGHHDASFTLRVYSHVTDEMKRESAKRMEKYAEKFNA